MYIPKHFHNNDQAAIKHFMMQNSFAILVSEVEGRPWATHIPLLLETNKEGEEVLTGHISRSNKQWQTFNTNKEVMAVF